MKYRRLGRTGLSASELGLGTVELGQDWGIEVPGEYGRPTEEAAEAVEGALLPEELARIEELQSSGAGEGAEIP